MGALAANSKIQLSLLFLVDDRKNQLHAGVSDAFHSCINLLQNVGFLHTAEAADNSAVYYRLFMLLLEFVNVLTLNVGTFTISVYRLITLETKDCFSQCLCCRNGYMLLLLQLVL